MRLDAAAQLLAVLQRARRVERELRSRRAQPQLVLQRRHQVGQQLAEVARQRADARAPSRRRPGRAASAWPYSLTVTPQPDAFITIASTAPAPSGRRPAATRRRCCGACRPGRRRGRSGAARIAPQQPAPSATTVWMPAASSTRAVALLMFGIIAGCTQPSSSSTLRGCARVGQRCARAGAGGRHLVLQRRRQQRPHGLAELHRRREQRRGQAFLQQPALRALAARPLDLRSSTMRRPISTRLPYCTPDGQVRLAVAAGQAAVEVQLRRCASTGAPSSTCLIR